MKDTFEQITACDPMDAIRNWMKNNQEQAKLWDAKEPLHIN